MSVLHQINVPLTDKRDRGIPKLKPKFRKNRITAWTNKTIDMHFQRPASKGTTILARRPQQDRRFSVVQ